MCNTFDEVDDKYWLLQYMYNEIASEHLQKRKAKVKINSLPWINGEVTKLMNKRYKQLRKAQTTNYPVDWKLYKDLRNEVHNPK